MDELQPTKQIVHDSLYVSFCQEKVAAEDFSKVRWSRFEDQIQVLEVLRVLRLQYVEEFDHVSVTLEDTEEHNLS